MNDTWIKSPSWTPITWTLPSDNVVAAWMVTVPLGLARPSLVSSFTGHSGCSNHGDAKVVDLGKEALSLVALGGDGVDDDDAAAAINAAGLATKLRNDIIFTIGCCFD